MSTAPFGGPRALAEPVVAAEGVARRLVSGLVAAGDGEAVVAGASATVGPPVPAPPVTDPAADAEAGAPLPGAARRSLVEPTGVLATSSVDALGPAIESRVVVSGAVAAATTEIVGTAGVVTVSSTEVGAAVAVAGAVTVTVVAGTVICATLAGAATTEIVAGAPAAMLAGVAGLETTVVVVEPDFVVVVVIVGAAVGAEVVVVGAGVSLEELGVDPGVEDAVVVAGCGEVEFPEVVGCGCGCASA